MALLSYWFLEYFIFQLLRANKVNWPECSDLKERLGLLRNSLGPLKESASQKEAGAYLTGAANSQTEAQGSKKARAYSRVQ